MFVPDARQALVGLSAALTFGLAAAWWVGRLKVVGSVRTSYTRKIFHFGIFTAAGVLHLTGGVGAVTAYGTTLALLVVYAVARGEGDALFEALSRETDAPHRKLFVVVPLVTTALGGVVVSLFFPSTAVVGYWVTGLGDAVGEPVGERWGKRRYRVPSLAGVPAHRSLEGSAAVFAASTLAAAAALWSVGAAPGFLLLGAALLVAAGATLVEAFTHHGLDNLTLQVAASGIAAAVAGV